MKLGIWRVHQSVMTILEAFELTGILETTG